MTQRPRTATEAAQYALPLAEPNQLDLFGFATARAMGVTNTRGSEPLSTEASALKKRDPDPLFDLCDDPWSVIHFVDGAPYADAKRVMSGWSDWPRPAMALVGPEHSGKTHLAHIWVKDLRGRFLTADDLAAISPEAAGALTATPLVVDGADRGVASLQLFSIFNALRQGGGPVLFIGRAAPVGWVTDSTDLLSRFKGLTSVKIGDAEDDTLAKILQSLCRKKFIRLGDNLAASLINRSAQTYEMLSGLADAIERLAEIDSLEPSARVLERILAYARGSDDGADDETIMGIEQTR